MKIMPRINVLCSLENMSHMYIWWKLCACLGDLLYMSLVKWLSIAGAGCLPVGLNNPMNTNYYKHHLIL